nr:hypothetical protein [uncultured bacterium]
MQRVCSGVPLLLLPFALVACGPAEPKAPDARIRRDTRIIHEECDTDAANAKAHDVNGDGRSDLRIAFRGGREACRAVDLNFDGRVDTWVFRDSQGSVRRRESDFDRDGRIDEIAIFSAGQLTSKQIATNLAGRLDTWQYYEGGVLKRGERDSDGDSVVDQWWEFPRTPKSDCALVHSDVDGDGRPDPGATVDMCKDEAEAAPESPAASSAAPRPSTTAARPPAPMASTPPLSAAPASASGGSAAKAPVGGGKP